MTGRTALIGANGQLGSDLTRLWPSSALGRDSELIALTHAEIDVTDEKQVRSVLGGIKPSLVINTAAYHRVDDCETTPLDAFRVNALGVKHLAETCRDDGTVLMHFSTDYVFDGAKKRPYDESDAPLPISAYGISKAAGEHFLRYVLPERHILVRSSGLYGAAGASGKGGNFVESMLRFAREGREIRVVDDQISAPTFTVDLASALLDLIAKDGRRTFHITNAGECSWYEFAQEIFRLIGLQPNLTPTSTAEYGAPALRPAYSVLENRRIREMGLQQPRPWQEALADYLRVKGRLAA
jgi:dTDP-4-dehydrorhamnose reductase